MKKKTAVLIIEIFWRFISIIITGTVSYLRSGKNSVSQNNQTGNFTHNGMSQMRIHFQKQINKIF